MGIIRSRASLAAGANIDLNLSPFDRFAGRGGRVDVAATGSAQGLELRLQIGSDTITQNYAVPVETGTDIGPTRETPTVGGFGAPADPITVNVSNPTAGALTYIVETNVQNA